MRIGQIILQKYDDYLKYAKSINPSLDYEQDVLHEVIADNNALSQYVKNPDAYIKRCIRNKYTKILNKEISGIRIGDWTKVLETLEAIDSRDIRFDPLESKLLTASVIGRLSPNPWPAIDAAIDVARLLTKLTPRERDCVSAYWGIHGDISDIANQYGIKIKSIQKVSERAVKKMGRLVVKVT